MAVKISESCITCNACVEVCPVGAIADDEHNPLGKKNYYVYPEKCVECVDIYDDPQCAAICPSIGCITWDMPFTKEYTLHYLNHEEYRLSEKNGEIKSPEFWEKKYRKDIPLISRGTNTKVEQEPDERKECN
jgi:ferredoxin